MALTNLLANRLLSEYFTTARTYLGLHITDPTNAGLATTEVTTISAPGYARQSVTWSTPANRAVSNVAIVSWVGLPMSSYGFLGCWDAAIGGNLLAVFTCKDPLVVATSGGSIYLPIGGIAVTIGGSPEGRSVPIPSDPFAVYVEDPLNPGVLQIPS